MKQVFGGEELRGLHLGQLSVSSRNLHSALGMIMTCSIFFCISGFQKVQPHAHLRKRERVGLLQHLPLACAGSHPAPTRLVTSCARWTGLAKKVVGGLPQQLNITSLLFQGSEQAIEI